MSKGIKLCGMYIADSSKRLSKPGIILKNAWLLGPSDPVLKFGKVKKYKEENELKEQDSTDKDNKQNNEKPQNKEASDYKSSDKESSDESKPSKDNKSGNESFNYSICEAYASIKYIYEAELDYKLADFVADAENAVGKRNDNSSNKDAGDKESNIKDKRPDKNDSKKEYPKLNDKDSFEGGDVLSFKVDLPKEGYTLWKIQLDKNVKDVQSVINAILSKKFKAAHAIASENLGHDGLVPLSAETYVYDNEIIKYVPPFLGHSNFGLDSGSDDRNSDPHITISLAVAPINARNNKTDEDMLIVYIYNVLGDITGGAIGRLATDITKKVKDTITGNSDRYTYSSTEGSDNENITDQLSKYLHKKFKYQGTHKNYSDFLKARKFILDQINDGNLSLFKENSTNVKKKFMANNIQDSKDKLMFY